MAIDIEERGMGFLGAVNIGGRRMNFMALHINMSMAKPRWRSHDGGEEEEGYKYYPSSGFPLDFPASIDGEAEFSSGFANGSCC